MMEPQPVFQVTDLKQFAYCPRVVYYTYCFPLLRPTTYKMESGLLAHDEEAEREARRSLHAYGLEDGERFVNVDLASATMNVRGRVDLVIRHGPPGQEEAIPVEYKDSTRRLGEHLKLSLAAYGLLLEEQWGLPVRRGFLYAIPLRRAEPVALTPELRRKVIDLLCAMTRMVERESMPEPTARRAMCLNCEFRRFCNDV